VETGKVINLMDALKSSLDRVSATGAEEPEATEVLEATGTEPAKKRRGRKART
jgi:non-homologous end joining protein Ku